MEDGYDDARVTRVLSQPLRVVGRPNSLGRGAWYSIIEILGRRELIGRLVSREVRSRYKNSSLGIVWSLFRPLAQLLIYYVAVGQFLGAARSIPDFAIFVFTGLTIWGLYNEIVSSGTNSIINNAGLVKKVYLPREIFPLASVGSAVFNFLIQFGILLVATIVLGKAPVHVQFLYVLLSVALVLVLGTAIALLLSGINVYLRDVQHVVEIALIILFWASPIVYSVGSVHGVLNGSWLEEAYLANPVTLAVLGMQKGMWMSGANDPAQYWPALLWVRMLIALAASGVLLWIAQRVFSRLQSNFAQEL